MTGGQADSSAQADPQLVGNSFVEQFYKFLHQFPEHVHRFYQDSSFMTRPSPNGISTTVTTMKGISDQILSMEYQNYQTEIITVDSQMSYYNGVTVLVSGYLTGKDLERRKFAQSFFLAPQEKGYFVFNDVFRYVDEKESALALAANNTVDVAPADDTPAPVTPSTPESSPAVESTTQVANDAVPNNTTTSSSADQGITTTNMVSKEVVTDPAMQNGNPSIPEKKIETQNDHHPAAVVTNQNKRDVQTNVVQSQNQIQNQNQVQPVVSNTQNQNTYTVTAEAADSASIQDAASRKSFASIVNALKDNSAPFQIKIPPKPVESPRTRASVSNPVKKNENLIKGNAIFVANLPMDITVEQLKEVFGKFGPIKPDGIKIRNNQIRLNCFAFIDFVSPDAMQSAIKASPILIGTRKAYIEERKGADPVKPSPSTLARLSQQQQQQRPSYVNTTSMTGGYQNDTLPGRTGRTTSATTGRSRVNSPRVRQNSEGGRVSRQAQAATK